MALWQRLVAAAFFKAAIGATVLNRADDEVFSVHTAFGAGDYFCLFFWHIRIVTGAQTEATTNDLPGISGGGRKFWLKVLSKP